MSGFRIKVGQKWAFNGMLKLLNKKQSHVYPSTVSSTESMDYPKDKRHLQGFAENIAAIIQSQSGCLSHRQ
jgi:hypothetical protein